MNWTLITQITPQRWDRQPTDTKLYLYWAPIDPTEGYIAGALRARVECVILGDSEGRSGSLRAQAATLEILPSGSHCATLELPEWSRCDLTVDQAFDLLSAWFCIAPHNRPESTEDIMAFLTYHHV